MSGLNVVYICSKCDAQAPKWSGRCFECGSWGTLEAQSSKVSTRGGSASGGKGQSDRVKVKNKAKSNIPTGSVMTFEDLQGTNIERIKVGQSPAVEIFPSGIPLGSLTLLAGEPGAGKSTLALQLALQFSSQYQVIYFSSEESPLQVKEKVTRLGAPSGNFLFSAEHNTEIIAATIAHHQPKLVVIDSIQTIMVPEVEAEPSSLAQLKAATATLMEIAKEQNVAVIIIGHVTKEGVVAGPKTLEHLVDVVFYLEGERDSRFRILRSSKNRYGQSGKVSVLQMSDKGLHIVRQAATAFISNYQPKPGSVITAVVDSGQVFFLEVQSLVTASNYGYPRRAASGFPPKRLEVLLAVMKKRLDLDFDRFDVYVNLVGGFRSSDPALDLAVCLSLISSIKNKVLSPETVIFGEVGLTGELRLVKETQLRLEESGKHSFKKIITSPLKNSTNKSIVGLSDLAAVIEHLGWL